MANQIPQHPHLEMDVQLYAPILLCSHSKFPSDASRLFLLSKKIISTFLLFFIIGGADVVPWVAGQAHSQPVDLDSRTVAVGLQELVKAALEDHPSIRSQEALGTAAAANVEQARWQFWPTPSVQIETVQARPNDAAYVGDKHVLTAGLTQPIWTGGRLSGELARAEAQAALSEAKIAEARETVALRAVQAYGDALAAQLKIAAYGRSRERHALLLEQVRRRAEDGLSAQADQLLAQSRWQSVVADIAAFTTQRAQALERLSQLAGRSVAQVASPDDASLPALSEDIQTLLDEAVRVSPTQARLDAARRVAHIETELARANLFPEVYLRLEQQGGSFTQTRTGTNTRLFVGLNSRLGAGLSQLTEVRAALAREDAAAEEMNAHRRTLLESVRSDYIAGLAAQDREVYLSQALSAAVEVSRSWDRQFLGGRKQWQDVMNAARELAQTDALLADATVARITSRWRLQILCHGVESVSMHDKPAATLKSQPSIGDDPSRP